MIPNGKMSIIFTLLLFFSLSCTRKYTSYDLVEKLDFQKSDYQVPAIVYPLAVTGRDELSSCHHQWLFFSNAEKMKNNAFDWMIKTLCPHQNYLKNVEVKESWWTLILFTRACVNVKAMCAELKKSSF